MATPANVVLTPLGFIAFPNLAEPDTGRPESSGKYSGRLYIKADVFRTEGIPLLKAVLEAGRRLKGSNVTLKDFKHTIYNVDDFSPDKKAKLPEQLRSGYIEVRAASKQAPIIKDAKQNLMAYPDVARIAGGDICRFVVSVYTYNQQGGGVALGLNAVQFKERGTFSIGGAGSAGVELLTDLEVKIDGDSDSLVGGVIPPTQQQVQQVTKSVAPVTDPLAF